MQELKNTIKKLADDRKTYALQLEDLYTAVTSDKNYFFNGNHAEAVNMALMAKEAYDLMTYATSDEYVDLYNRMLEDQSWLT